MATSLKEAVISSLSAGSNWTDGFEIFQSLEEQQLLPEEANFNCISALLAVHNLDDRYTLQMKENSEYMSPHQGDLPFLRYQNTVVGACDILEFLKEKDYVLSTDQGPEKKLLVLGVLSLIKIKLLPLELYSVWIDPKNIEVTNERFSFGQPKQLGKILCWRKKEKVKAVLQAFGLLSKDEDQIQKEAREIFGTFCKMLEGGKYLVGDTLSEADVFVYGHLQAILESKLPNNFLLKILEEFPSLTKFCLEFSQLHLGQQAMLF